MDVLESSEDYFTYDSWFAVTLSFGMWTLFYLLIQAAIPHRSPEYCSRVLTLFHGTTMTFLGLNQCFAGKSPLDDVEEKSSQEQSFIMMLSLGYFLEDLGWCLYYQTETALMTAHHVYSCFALARILFRGHSGRIASCGLGALEVTNPLLQARWFTRTHGYHDTPLFTSIEITFMIMFFTIRIFLGTIYLMIVVIQPQNTWEIRILTAFIYFMSWMFMINIIKYFNHKYLKANVEAELAHINTS